MEFSKDTSLLPPVELLKDTGLFPPGSKKISMLNARCIRAEDKVWDLDLVPFLSMLCLRALADNFLENPVLEELNDKDQSTLISLLPTSLPLDKQAKDIPHQAYWKKCCEDSGQTIRISKYENDWRRAFMELHAEHCISNFRPDKDDLDLLLEQLQICKPFVQRLIIDQVWQKDPLNPADLYFRNPESPKEGEEEEERENPLLPVSECQCLQFTEVLSILENLTELDITFSVKECGDGFAWHLFELGEMDCEDLGRALKEKPLLRSFRLRRSRMDGRNAMILLFAIQGHPSLQTLDFSHNRIGDLGAKVVSKLILTLPSIEHFDITNNEIRHAGSEYLAYALSKHPTLKSMNVSANQLGDKGGVLLCRALSQNCVLENAIFTRCSFGSGTFEALGEMLTINKSLRLLNVSNNNFSDVEAEKLIAGLEKNSSLSKLDIRFCKAGEKVEYEVYRLLKRTIHTGDDNYILPQSYSSIMRSLAHTARKPARTATMAEAFSKALASSRKIETSVTSVVTNQPSEGGGPTLDIQPDAENSAQSNK